MKKKEILEEFLPFTKKAGTIGKITTIEDGYLRYDYDAKGNLTAGKFVPKSRGSDLKYNFYQDVLGYLQTNQTKFLNYKSERLKTRRNLRSILIDVSISFILSTIGLSLAFLSVQGLPISWMTVVSIGIFSVSGIYCGVKIKELVEYKIDFDKGKFIQQYQTYQMKLNENNLGLDKKYSPPTEYQTLSNEKNKGNTLFKNRILKKENNI